MARTRLAALGSALSLSVTLACSNPDASGPPDSGSDPVQAGSAAARNAGVTSGVAGRPGAAVPSGPAASAGRSGGSPAATGAGANATQAGGQGGADAPSAGGSGPTAGAAPALTPTPAPRPIGPQSKPSFANLAPPMGMPLDGTGMPLDPPPPAGWIWYAIDGAVCRDGSPTGFYVHAGSTDKLVIFLEGGGACSNAAFCSFNPMNVNQVLAGDGQIVINTALGAIDGRQQPGVYTQADHFGEPAGMFDFANPSNPFKDWNQVYVPYCTGDVHFGTNPNGSVPDLTGQKFVGYENMKLFMARLVPTFKTQVNYVILTGSSAGGFGAALNYSMVQDSFGEIPVDAISDSGPPFDDAYMPVCMQKRWRESWGFEGSLPPDCETCRQPDGGGLLKLADYLLEKHPDARIGFISTMQDEVIRLFFSVGLNDCAMYDTADPVAITVGQLVDPALLTPAEVYTAGLNDLRTRYGDTKRLATFYMLGDTPNFHQHLFRPSFYDPTNGSSIAAFVAGFIEGKVETVGP
jgi:Pectinacetylesterase